MKIKIISSGSKGNCYLVESKSTRILIECGIPIRKIRAALDYDLSSIDACLISHEHGDHAKAVNDLIRFGVDCHASHGTIRALNNHNIMYIINDIFPRIDHIGSFRIRNFDIVHDAAEPVGFLIYDTDSNETLLYISDTCRIDQQFNGWIDYLMIECNYDQIADDCQYHDRLITSHLSLDDVYEFIETLDISMLKRIYLIHTSKSNADKDKMKSTIQRLTGKEVVLA